MGHTYSNILLHVVFSTKGRRPTVKTAFRERLYQYLAGVARHEFGRALTIGGTENHIHGLLSMATDASAAEAMRKWKSLFSGWVHKAFPSHVGFAWQSGYGVFSVSQSNAPRVIKYIEEQEEHHRRQTFEEEFIALLKKHGVDYNPRYVWD